MEGTPQRLILWTEVLTGMTLDDHDTVRRLDYDAWHQRRRELNELGGSPLP